MQVLNGNTNVIDVIKGKIVYYSKETILFYKLEDISKEINLFNITFNKVQYELECAFNRGEEKEKNIAKETLEMYLDASIKDEILALINNGVVVYVAVTKIIDDLSQMFLISKNQDLIKKVYYLDTIKSKFENNLISDLLDKDLIILTNISEIYIKLKEEYICFYSEEDNLSEYNNKMGCINGRKKELAIF